MAQISLNQLAKLCRNVGQALHAGLDIRSVWERETARAAPTERRYFQQVLQQIRDGAGIADSMKATDGYFPQLFCELVNVGEKSGRLERVLARLGEHYEHVLKMRRNFIVGIAWPMIQLVGAIFIISVMILLIGMLNPEMDVLGLGLSPSASLTVFLMGVFTIGVAITLPIVGFSRGWLGPTPMMIALKVPVIGKSLQMIALSRMAWALGMAIDSGLDAQRSMRLALATTSNIYYTMHTDRIDRRLEQGIEMHLALRETGVFPSELLEIVENGELTGQLAESLEHLSNDYRSRAQSSSGILVMLATFVIWAGTAAFIMFFIISLVMNLYIGPLNEMIEDTY